MAKRSKLLVRKDVVQIERETVIMTMKPKLVMALADLLAVNSDREEFLKLCKRIEAIVRAWYHLQFEDLLELYTLFDPVHGAEKLEKQNIPPARVDNLEQRFLQILFQIMEKSNYKILSDEEVEIATSGQYLLNLPITADGSKLDDKLFTRFFKENSISGLPKFANQYIIFRQGIGIDRTTRFFFAEKLDALISRFWNWFLTRLRLRKVTSGELLHLRDPDGIVPVGNGSNYNLCIERIHIKTMDISFGNLFGRITIQEPTFERMILVYRGATTKNDSPKYGNREICIKHFRHIPMADMELVLPEKKNPSLTPMDWTKLLISAILGLFLKFYAGLRSRL